MLACGVACGFRGRLRLMWWLILGGAVAYVAADAVTRLWWLLPVSGAAVTVSAWMLWRGMRWLPCRRR
jgi:hypothetical protein